VRALRRVRGSFRRALFCAIGALAVSPAASAQTPPPPPASALPGLRPGRAVQTLRVFLDCDRCDFDFLTTNVSFVDYVRDRTVADVHVLVSTQDTPGGGLAWTLKFIGLGRFQDHAHTMTFSTPGTATGDDQRREFARVLKLGLVFFAADTPAAAHLNVTFDQPAGDARTTPKQDPWNFWLFQLNANGNLNGQALTSSASYSFNVSANRTTDKWKINFSGNTNQNRNVFSLDDGSTVRSLTSSWSANQLIVKSVNAHWSIGGTAAASRSTFSNENRDYRLAPGVEFDVFPYSQSTRRILTVLYTVGVSHYDYVAATIFGKLHETVPEHTLAAGLSVKEPWGSLQAMSNFTQQLDALSRYRLSTNVQANIRIVNGLSFNVYAEYDRIRNQIFLPAGGASSTSILLQIQQLATGFSYSGGVGFTYSFGSIFNNIVNPRFNGS